MYGTAKDVLDNITFAFKKIRTNKTTTTNKNK
jgi:hypothetical protein